MRHKLPKKRDEDVPDVRQETVAELWRKGRNRQRAGEERWETWDKRRELVFAFVKEIQKRGTKFESSREFLKNLEIPQLSLAPAPAKSKIVGENL